MFLGFEFLLVGMCIIWCETQKLIMLQEQSINKFIHAKDFEYENEIIF